MKIVCYCVEGLTRLLKRVTLSYSVLANSTKIMSKNQSINLNLSLIIVISVLVLIIGNGI